MRHAIDASRAWSAFNGFRIVIVAPQFGRRLHRIGQREDVAQRDFLAAHGRWRRDVEADGLEISHLTLVGLSNAPIKKLMVVNGGANPTGDECAGQHWHGFIGMESEAISHIAEWIKAPAN